MQLPHLPQTKLNVTLNGTCCTAKAARPKQPRRCFTKHNARSIDWEILSKHRHLHLSDSHDKERHPSCCFPACSNKYRSLAIHRFYRLTNRSYFQENKRKRSHRALQCQNQSPLQTTRMPRSPPGSGQFPPRRRVNETWANWPLCGKTPSFGPSKALHDRLTK
jgi:hypothetical protein